MTRKYRPVADRQMALQPAPQGASFTLAGVRAMYAGAGGKEFHCTVSGFCRTRIFEFPGIDFHPDGDEPHHIIYSSPPVQACIATNVVDYFVNSTSSTHYAISPKPKPRWDVHLPEVGDRAGSLAGGIRPLIAGPYGSGA